MVFTCSFMLVTIVLLIEHTSQGNWWPVSPHFPSERCERELLVSSNYVNAQKCTNRDLGSSPIPLQDFPHLLRKLISPLVKANRCTMIGNLPILQTLFIRAQGVFAFPVSYLLQFDEQNDNRVQFFCSVEVSLQLAVALILTIIAVHCLAWSSNWWQGCTTLFAACSATTGGIFEPFNLLGLSSIQDMASLLFLCLLAAMEWRQVCQGSRSKIYLHTNLHCTDSTVYCLCSPC